MEYSPALNRYLIGNRTAINLFTSDDNLNTWIERAPGIVSAQNWHGGAWSPSLNLFAIACATLGGSCIATSPDGITWTKRTLSDLFFKGIIWVPEKNLFVCTSDLSGQISTSPDGITWTNFAQTNTGWVDVAYSPSLDRYVAIFSTGSNALAGNRAAFATNPSTINWGVAATPTIGGVAPNWVNIVWATELNLFVACSLSDVTEGCFMTSPDGINWTLVRTIPAVDRESISYSSSLKRLLATSDGAMKISTSEDGTIWINRKIRKPLGGTILSYWDSTNKIFITDTAVSPTQRFQFSKSGK